MATNVNPVAVFMPIPSSSAHDVRLARRPLVVITLPHERGAHRLGCGTVHEVFGFTPK